ncbi:MAG: Flp pilus assembly complex ATPase component TadA [Marinobacter sp.]|nr:Flp pilus assembly complex ATPase component TadA [Marinobacter sp.]
MSVSLSSPEQLRADFATQSRRKLRMLGQVLMDEGLLTEQHLGEALMVQHREHTGERLGEILVRLGHVEREDILTALSGQLGIPVVEADNFDVEESARQRIPESVARHYHVMPLMMHADCLFLATTDPTDAELMKTLRFVAEAPIEPVLSTRGAIDRAISRYYGGVDELESIQTNAEEEISPGAVERIRRAAEDQPTVRFVDRLIDDAIRQRASDIHIRPRPRDAGIFLRVDGTLVEVRSISKGVLPAVVSRIKIMGNMDIAEHRLPQDGRYKLPFDGQTIDFRLSVIPTVHGESVVIRILDTRQSMVSIDQIGFTETDTGRFRDIVSHNQGILLVTGPTGSGKTTTLYAALHEIRNRNLNIITVEDPVEYQVENVLQIQIKPKIGYTFARALRHILRHDPDVIMLGEIRDPETALMAMESALTGHLVLSTLHTNGAASTILRLLEIGAESYLVNATLLGVLAQRLVRKNCPHCLVEEEISDDVRAIMGIGPEEAFYVGKGCKECNNRGFKGRMAAYELLQVSPEMRKLILPGALVQDIEAQARQDGMVPLTDHALALARQKLIPLAEAYRVRLD